MLGNLPMTEVLDTLFALAKKPKNSSCLSTAKFKHESLVVCSTSFAKYDGKHSFSYVMIINC